METNAKIADRIMRNAAAIQARLVLTTLGQLDAMRNRVEGEAKRASGEIQKTESGEMPRTSGGMKRISGELNLTQVSTSQ